ncbi:MAG: hypothetical protein ACRDTR_00755 [Rubrobacter sp.]
MIRPCNHTLRRAAALLLLMTTVLLALTLPAVGAQDEQENNPGPADARGERADGYPIGVYITSLRDFDTVGDSFGIDFWVWSIHPPGENPLENMEFVNAKQLETRLDKTARRGDREWSRLKARATVL